MLRGLLSLRRASHELGILPRCAGRSASRPLSRPIPDPNQRPAWGSGWLGNAQNDEYGDNDDDDSRDEDLKRVVGDGGGSFKSGIWPERTALTCT